MEPLVNILLPTYEPDPAHLRRAIEDVLAQTEKRWTLFVRDDGSKTDTAAIVRPYLKDPRIAFVRGRGRLGIGGNWNAVLRGSGISDRELRRLHTSAPTIQYLFQDDRWDPHYLKRALEILDEHPDVGCVSVQHSYLFEDDTPRGGYDLVVNMRRNELAPGKHDGTAFLIWWIRRGLRPNIVGEPSFMLMRRGLVRQTGAFREDLPQLIDVEYWVRLFPRTAWWNLAETLGSFRVHGKGASERNRQEGRGLFDRLQCLQSAMISLPRGRERRVARDAIVKDLQELIRRFFAHRRSGGRVHRSGARTVLRFMTRHPLLALRGVRSALRQRKQK